MIQEKFEKKILITNKLGLHARAAAKFVKVSDGLESRVTVRFGSHTVSGSSILGLMSLAANKGSVIRVKCGGNSPSKDLACILELIKNNFG